MCSSITGLAETVFDLTIRFKYTICSSITFYSQEYIVNSPVFKYIICSNITNLGWKVKEDLQHLNTLCVQV